MQFVTVSSRNVESYGIFCIKDKLSPGYKEKVKWFKDKLNNGLVLILAINNDGKQVGFIEFTDAESAWRPIIAPGYLFIQCIAVFSKKDRNQAVGTKLIELCEDYARNSGKAGVCAMTSKGPWMANSSVFSNNQYQLAGQKDRFELYYKPLEKGRSKPQFFDWHDKLRDCQGWQLFYAHQCPWHYKSINALIEVAKKNSLDLKLNHLQSPEQAQQGPSGYGTFALIKDGKLLADHYISETRFKTILKIELVG